MKYRLIGAYGEGTLSHHHTLSGALKALEKLSWYELSAYPHDAYVADTDGRISDNQIRKHYESLEKGK